MKEHGEVPRHGDQANNPLGVALEAAEQIGEALAGKVNEAKASRPAGGSGGTSQEKIKIDEAKKVIQQATEENELLRKSQIKELRKGSVSTESIDVVKTRLSASNLKPIEWLTDVIPVSSMHNVEVAAFVEDLANNGKLAKDPHWLTSQTLRLVYRSSSNPDPAARLEVAHVVSAVRKQVEAIVHKNANPEFDMQTYDELFYGGKLRRNPVLVDAKGNTLKSPYDEEHPENEDIIDPELIKITRESLNYYLKNDPKFVHDSRHMGEEYKKFLDKCQEFGIDKKAIEQQEHVQMRFQRIQQNADLEHKNTYRTIKDRDWFLSKGVQPRGGADEMEFQRMVESEIEELITLGPEKWNERFTFEKVQNPGNEFDITLEDQGRLEDVKRYCTFLYSEEKAAEIISALEKYRDTVKRLQGLMHHLGTSGGAGLEEALKGFLHLSDTDYDFVNQCIKDQRLSEFTQQAILNVISRRKDKHLMLKETCQRKGGASINEKRIKTLEELRRSHPDQFLKEQEMELTIFQYQQKQFDYGVTFYDKDFTPNLEDARDEKKFDDRRKELQEMRQAGIKFSAEQQKEYDNLTQLDRAIDALRAKPARSKMEEDYLNVLLDQQKERQLKIENPSYMSPVEREAWGMYKTMIQTNHPGENIEDLVNDPDIQMSLVMCRYKPVIDRRLYEITSAYYVAPEGGKMGEGVMRSMYGEDMVRLYNIFEFAERFDSGGAMGKEARTFFLENILDNRGVKTRKLADTEGWNQLFRKAVDVDPQVALTMQAMEDLEETSGLSMWSVLTGSIGEIGGLYNTWRGPLVIEGPAREQLMKELALLDERHGSSMDNIMLQLQLIMVRPDPSKPETLLERQRIFEKIIRREPLWLSRVMNKQRLELLKQYPGVKQDIFEHALALAQSELINNTEYRMNGDIDLGEEQMFKKLVSPYLKQLGVVEAEVSGYKGYLNELQKFGRQEATKKESGLLNYEIPLLFDFADVPLDMTDARMAGNIGFARKARDEGNAKKALMDGAMQFLSDPNLLLARNPTASIDKIEEIVNTMNAYTSRENAEKMGKILAQVFLKMNSNRLTGTLFEAGDNKFLKWASRAGGSILTPDWIPGFSKVARWMSTWDLRPIANVVSKLGRTPESQKNIKDYLYHFPQTIGGAISYSLKYKPGIGAAMHEGERAQFIMAMSNRGMFYKCPQFVGELLRENKATLSWRVIAGVRRYWWIVGGTVLAMAFANAYKQEVEEKNKH